MTVFFSYFCPFSKEFDACKKFEKLNGKQQALTVFVTILATIASLPFFGMGGVAAFRKMVKNYTFNELQIDENPQEPNKQKKTARKVRRYASKDDGIFGMAPQTGKQLYNVETQKSEWKEGEKLSSIVKSSQVQDLQVQVKVEYQSLLKCRMTETETNHYIEKIKELKKQKEITELDFHTNDFLSLVEQCIPAARLQHEIFKKKFQLEALPPCYDSKKRETCSSLFQLKTAISMAKKAFPVLTSVAFNEEQKAAVSYLIQVILCGENVTEFPGHNCCFRIFDLENKGSKAVEKKGNLDSCIATYLGEGDLFDKINEGIERFANDCLDRTLNSFHCGNYCLPLGNRNGSNVLPAQFLIEVKNRYLGYLKSHPSEIKGIVENYKKNEWVITLKEKLGGNTTKEDSMLPKEFLTQLFNKNKFNNNTKVKESLNQIVENSSIDPSVVEDLAKKSNCTTVEIESLLRLKFIEMMLLMNQGFQFDENLEIFKLLPAQELNCKGINSSFDFGDGKTPFNTLNAKTSFGISIPQDQYESNSINDPFADFVTCAITDVEDKFEHFNEANAKRTLSPMRNIRFGWQISEKVMDDLTAKVDPQVVEDQPKVKYPLLLEKLNRSNAALKKMTESGNGIWSYWASFWTPTAEEIIKKIEAAEASIGDIPAYTTEFLKQISFLEKPIEEVIGMLNEHRILLVKVHKELSHIQTKDLDEKNKGKLDQLVRSLDQIIELIPETENRIELVHSAQKTFFEKLAGTFLESADPKDIMWKVKKYESQLKELKAGFELHLKEQLESEESNSAKELYEILKNVEILSDDKRYSQAYLKKVRDAYNEQFLTKLRQLLKKDPKDENLLKICEILFTTISLASEAVETLETFDRVGALTLGQKPEELSEKAHGSDPFIKRLHTLYERLLSVPYGLKAPLLNQLGNSARGQWNKDFDPYRQGNPVHVIYNLLIGDKKVLALGMGTPTREVKESVLIEEFKGFIRSYKKQNKKHLFVVNQNTIPKKGMMAYVVNGDETKRCDLILDAQERKSMKGALYCIALSKNSKFYSQSGDYKKMDKSEEFKKELYNQIFDLPRKKSGCYIPTSIKKEIPDFENKVIRIMTHIHEHLFESKEELSRDERKIFIEIYYDTLTKFIIKELDFDSFNISCKDAIDRGAGSNAQLFANCALVHNKGKISENLEVKQKIELLMNVRALFVRKRPPLHERFERFIHGLEFTLEHSEKLINLHNAVFGDLAIIPV